MNRLRILHTNMHRGGWGGQPNRILTLACHLTRRGHHVVIAAPKRSTLIKRAAEAGLPCYDNLRFPRGFHPFIYVSEVSKLKNLIAKERIEIVHTHGSQDTWAGAVAGRLNGIKVVRTRHNTFPVARHPLNRLLYTKLIDKIITVSDGVFPMLERTGFVDIKAVTVIHSAVDVERFNPSKYDASQITAEFGFGSETKVVGMVGRLAVEKGHRYLLEAARVVAAEYPNSRFLLIGEGPLLDELKQYSIQLGLSDKVIFTGLRRDVPALLAAMDVFVLCPIAGESLGTAILEALAMKTPVVATDVGGVYNSVRDGETGFLVPSHDSNALATKILELLQDARLAERLGRNGRQLMMQEFSEETLTIKTERVYFTLLRSGRGG